MGDDYVQGLAARRHAGEQGYSRGIRERRAIATAQGRKMFGRKRTDEYDAWIKEAGWLLRSPALPPSRIAMRYGSLSELVTSISTTLSKDSDLFVRMGVTEGDKALSRGRC
jgi:hypothetical protein